MLTKAQQYYKKRRLEKRKLVDEAIGLWKKAVIKRYGDRCEICGKESGPPHHFFPKGRFGNLKYTVENGISLCVGCHLAHHKAGDPRIHQTIIAKRGKVWYDGLEAKSREYVLLNNKWIEEQIARLKTLV